MNLQDPALTFALALTVGVIAQVIARRIRVPGILLLLASGLLLGPEFADLVRPDTLGDGLSPIVGLAVAVILFEGGLHLRRDRLKRVAAPIRRLISIGAIVTILGAAAATMLLLGWGILEGLLFGTLVSVTGPTVINPLTKRIRLKKKLRTILEAEGVLIDPVGAIFAVLAFDLVLASGAGAVGAGVLGLFGRWGLGLLAGALGGLVMAAVYRLKVIPPDLQNIFALGSVLTLFQASHAILPESGILTVAIAGLVVGNWGPTDARQLVEFKEQLTSLLVGLLFVLLAAAVDLDAVVGMGIPGLITVGILVVLVRPAAVLASTRGSGLTANEKGFLMWLAPRGIVAFAVSSLFATELAHQGRAAFGDELRALVFLVIAVTVVVLGGLAGLAAWLLKVRYRSNHGYVIVGANPVGRALGKALREGAGPDHPVIFMDTNPGEVREAEEAGFRAILGNASQERSLARADVASRRAMVTLTPNEAVNLLVAEQVIGTHMDVPCFVATDPREQGVVPEQVEAAGARLLFGFGLSHESWAHVFRQDKGEIGVFRYTADEAARASRCAWLTDPRVPLLALVHRQRRGALPVSNDTEFRPGDLIWIAWHRRNAKVVAQHLQTHGLVTNASYIEDGAEHI